MIRPGVRSKLETCSKRPASRWDGQRPNPQDGAWGWPLKILGLLISVGAAALGAPFWYRLLDRVGTLRNTGRPPTPGS